MQTNAKTRITIMRKIAITGGQLTDVKALQCRALLAFRALRPRLYLVAKIQPFSKLAKYFCKMADNFKKLRTFAVEIERKMKQPKMLKSTILFPVCYSINIMVAQIAD